MELKTKYQYTYFIYPYLVDQKKYDKYLLKLLNNSNCKIKEFESQKDADLYSYFLPKVRDMLFWSMDYTKNKTEKLRKMESGIDLSLKLKMKLLSGLRIILWKMEIMLILKKLIGKNIMVN